MKVSTEIEGVVVEGKMIEYSDKSLVVEMTHPYRNISDGKHVPFFTRDKERFFAHEREGIALGLLKRLYKVRHFFEANREALVAEYREVTSEPGFPSHDGEAQLHTKRRALKEQLRSGAISIQEYEREIGFARVLRDHLKSEVSAQLDAFFAHRFPTVINDALRDQLILLLETESQNSPTSKN